MAAALIWRNCMDFIYDYGPGRCQHPASGFGSEKNVKRFRSRNDDVGRAADHPLALASRSISGANPGPDFYVWLLLLPKFFADAADGHLKVAVDVVRQRLER